jgi:predicted DNA-binding transcriptional regulator AlpA
MVIDMAGYMGAAEIGALLGVSRQRVQQLVSRPDFPVPLVTLNMGKVWDADDVKTWAKKHRP